ncbi:MAG TPA: HAMP domain-containing sensor histidine kinase [Phycisphaerales bacterium]|nr:HAMP domain-containing sensor histidine kinase [Phycisphaerales bacterium]
MWRGISLANKCLLLFGAAVVLIIVAALTVPWIRMTAIVDQNSRDAARQLVVIWENLIRERASAGTPTAPGVEESLGGASIALLSPEQVAERAGADRFLRRAWERFGARADASEHHEAYWFRAVREDRYARAVRDDSGRLTGLMALRRQTPAAVGQLIENTIYLLGAGLIALGLAVLVFYLITTRLILGPVRALRDTAEQVRAGNLETRSRIETGDEFQELSEAFNQMLEALGATEVQLRAINKSLDLKLNELADRNEALYEANKLKGEFLASVSHELRTPLNSIIGFAELLTEMADREAAAGDDSTRLARRRRYLDHILTAARSLLELINGLLEMAKLEAGRMELRLEPISVQDACEGLVALMRPLADKNSVTLALEVEPGLPPLVTDPKKFEQILFNLLSNAIKFTGDPGRTGGGGPGGAGPPAPAGARAATVTLRAERLVGRAGSGPEAEDRIRVSVLDTGPGIRLEDLEVIFEKFRQLESGLTRAHAGTGLGLAIAKDLTTILQGEIQVQSEVGRGSMFSVILPLELDSRRAQEMRLEMRFRGDLAAEDRRATGAAPAEESAGEPQPRTAST